MNVGTQIIFRKRIAILEGADHNGTSIVRDAEGERYEVPTETLTAAYIVKAGPFHCQAEGRSMAALFVVEGWYAVVRPQADGTYRIPARGYATSKDAFEAVEICERRNAAACKR